MRGKRWSKPEDILTRLRLPGKNSYTVTADSRELEFDISTTVAKRWFGVRCRDGPHEPEMASRLADAVEEVSSDSNGATVLDVGAHLGFFTVLASAAGAHTVHAFDLDQERLGIVRDHPQLRDDATLVCGAIGEHSGQTVGYAPRSAAHRSTTHVTDASNSAQQVATLCLDDYCSTEMISPDVVKIDIEGREVDALRGFESTLASDPPKHLLVELHPSLLQDRGKKPENVTNLLRDVGYHCEEIPGNELRVHATHPS